MNQEDRQKELESLVEKYNPSLDTAEIATVLNCSHRKALLLQMEGKLKSYVLDIDSQKKTYKTTKVDIINYIIDNEVQGEQND